MEQAAGARNSDGPALAGEFFTGFRQLAAACPRKLRAGELMDAAQTKPATRSAKKREENPTRWLKRTRPRPLTLLERGSTSWSRAQQLAVITVTVKPAFFSLTSIYLRRPSPVAPRLPLRNRVRNTRHPAHMGRAANPPTTERILVLLPRVVHKMGEGHDGAAAVTDWMAPGA